MTTRYDEMKKDYEEFDAKHPEVWVMFVEFTFDRISRGFKNYSVYGIFERMRWECALPTYGEDEFKLNNNHRPFYARRFMKEYPRYDGFFRTREQKSMTEPPVGLPPLKPSDFPTQ